MEDLIGGCGKAEILSMQTWEGPYAFTWIKINLSLLELDVSSTFMRALVGAYERSVVPSQPAVQHNAITFVLQPSLLATDYFLFLALQLVYFFHPPLFFFSMPSSGFAFILFSSFLLPSSAVQILMIIDPKCGPISIIWD